MIKWLGRVVVYRLLGARVLAVIAVGGLARDVIRALRKRRA